MPEENTTDMTQTTDTTDTTETTETTSTTGTTSTTSTTETTSTTTITPFTLPRLDWHDEEGRIYKDALIENFNALETKLNEINSLSAFSTAIPDISNLSLDDVTLSDDDNKVVNLKSFLEIFKLVNYPIELTFNGTKISRLAYWNSEYDYIVRSNVATNATDTNKFIVYDFGDDTVTSKATITELDTDEKLIGCYLDGRVITLTTPYSARFNLMYLLANMAKVTTTQGVLPGKDYYYFPGNKQQAAIGHVESRGLGHVGDMTFQQEGRTN